MTVLRKRSGRHLINTHGDNQVRNELVRTKFGGVVAHTMNFKASPYITATRRHRAVEHAQTGSLQFAMNKVSTHQPTQDLCLYKIMNEIRVRWHVHRSRGCTLAESGRIIENAGSSRLGTCNLVTPRELKPSLLHLLRPLLSHM